MILNCPSCSAKFMISSTALGADGREVRCGKCGHMWFQAGERDSLDELPADLAEDTRDRVDTDSFDIGFEPHVEKPEPIPEVLKPSPEPPTAPNVSKGIFAKIEEIVPLEKQKNIAAVMVALAIALVSFYIFVANHNSIGRAIPFLGAAYDKMGFPLATVKPQIAFDQLKLSKESQKIVGTGYVLNLTDQEVPVSYMTVELTDFDYKVLKTINIKMGQKTLQPEAREKIEFYFEDVPKEAVSVRIRLVQ